MASTEERNIVVFCDNDSNTVSFHLKDLAPKGRRDDLLGDTLASNYTLIHIGDARGRRKKPKSRRTLDDSGGGSAATSPSSDQPSDVEEDPGVTYDSDSSDDSGADSEGAPTVSVMVEHLPINYPIPMDGDEKATAVAASPALPEPSPNPRRKTAFGSGFKQGTPSVQQPQRSSAASVAGGTAPPATPASGNDAWEFTAVSLENQDENSVVSSFTDDEIEKLQSILLSKEAKEVLGPELPGVLGSNTNRCQHPVPHSREDLLVAMSRDHCYTTKMPVYLPRGDSIASMKEAGQEESEGEDDEEGDDEADDDEEDDDFKLNEDQTHEVKHVASTGASRRSERQLERQRKEEVERIRAQNQEMLERERISLKEKQLKEQQEKQEEDKPDLKDVLQTPLKPSLGKPTAEVARQSAGKGVPEDRVKPKPDDHKNDADVSGNDGSEPKRRSDARKRAEVKTTPAPAANAGKKLRQTTLPFLPIAPSRPAPVSSSEATIQSSESELEKRRASQRDRKPTVKCTQSEEYLNILANATLDRFEKKKTVGGSENDIVSAASGGDNSSKTAASRQSSGGKTAGKAARTPADTDSDGNKGTSNSSGAPNGDGNKRHRKTGNDKASLDDDDDEGDDGDDENDEDENDPNKLWCICRKPHNNRFMICCDECQEWFHGTCVNITKSQGQKMEQEKKQWICPTCKKVPQRKTPQRDAAAAVVNTPAMKPRRRSGRGGSEARASPARSTTPAPGRKAGKVPEFFSAPTTPAAANDQPAEKAEKPEEAENGVKSEKAEKVEDVEKVEKPKRKTRGSDAPPGRKTPPGRKSPETASPAPPVVSPAPPVAPPKEVPRRCASAGCVKISPNPAHAYCSNRCIFNAVDRYQCSFSKPSTTRIPVIDKKKDKILKGFEAPMLEDLLHFLRTHPAYEIYLPSSQGSQPAAVSPVPEKKGETDGGEKSPTPKEESESQLSKPTDGKDSKTPRKEAKHSYEYDPAWSPGIQPSSVKKDGAEEEHVTFLKKKPQQQNPKPVGKITVSTPRKVVMLTEIPPVPGANAAPVQIPSASQKLAEKKQQGHVKQQPKKDEQKDVAKQAEKAPEEESPPKKEAGKRKAEDRSLDSPPRKTAAVADKKNGAKDKKPVPAPVPGSAKKPTTPAPGEKKRPISPTDKKSPQEESKKSPSPGERKNSTSSTISSSSSSTKKSTDSRGHSKSRDRRESFSSKHEQKDKEKRKDEKHKHGKEDKHHKEDKHKEDKRKEGSRRSSSSTKEGEQMKSPRGDDESKGDGSKKDGTREFVKTKFCEAFLSRSTDTSKKFKGKVTEISLKIEKELWATHGSDMHKYKNKFRSLVFNLKELKNDLHERVLEGVVEPEKVVHMSPNELAPKELAMWRQQSEKHDLEMIKKQEYGNLRSGDVFLVKTHKGEVIIEGEDGAATEKSREVSKQLEEEGSALELRPKPHVEEHDTTDQHGKHAFDVGCKICVAEMRKIELDDEEREKERRAKRKHSSGDSDEEMQGEEEEKTDEKIKDEAKKKRRHDSSKDDDKPAKVKVASPAPSGSNAPLLVAPPEAPNVEAEPLVEVDDDEWKKDQRKQDLQRQLKLLEKRKLEIEIQEKRERSRLDARCEETVQEATKAINAGSFGGRRSDEDKGGGYSSGSATVDPSPPVVDVCEPQKSQTSLAPGLSLAGGDSDYSDKEEDERHRSAECWAGHIVVPDPEGTSDLKVEAYPVSGFCDHLFDDVEINLQVVGRVAPSSVFCYFEDMRRRGNKEMVIIRLHPKRGVDRVHNGKMYTRVFKLLSGKRRFGVLEPHAACVKDLYLVPLGKDDPIPEQFQPIEGPGFERQRQDLLLCVLWRKKRERSEKYSRRWLRPGSDKRASMSPIDIDSVIPVSRSFTPPLPESHRHHHSHGRGHHQRSQSHGKHHRHHRSAEERPKPAEDPAIDRSSPYEPGEGFSDDEGPKTPPLPTSGYSSTARLPMPPFLSPNPKRRESEPQEIVAVSDSDDEEIISPARKIRADPIVERFGKQPVEIPSDSDDEVINLADDDEVEPPVKSSKEQKRPDRWDQRPEDVAQKDPRFSDARRRQDMTAAVVSPSTNSSSSVTQSPIVVQGPSPPGSTGPSPSPCAPIVSYQHPPQAIPLPAPVTAPPPLPASAPPQFMQTPVTTLAAAGFIATPGGFMQRPLNMGFGPPTMTQAMNMQRGFMPFAMPQPPTFMTAHPPMGHMTGIPMPQMLPRGPQFWRGPLPPQGMPGVRGMGPGVDVVAVQQDVQMHGNMPFNEPPSIGMQPVRPNWDRPNRGRQPWRGGRDRHREPDRRDRDRGRDRDRKRRWDDSPPPRNRDRSRDRDRDRGRDRDRDRDRSRDRSRDRDRGRDRDRDRDKRRSNKPTSREPEPPHPGAEEGEIID